MTEHVLVFPGARKSWPSFTLREKRVRLVEEKLATLVAEARLLGIDSVGLTTTLRQLYEEES